LAGLSVAAFTSSRPGLDSSAGPRRAACRRRVGTKVRPFVSRESFQGQPGVGDKPHRRCICDIENRRISVNLKDFSPFRLGTV